MRKGLRAENICPIPGSRIRSRGLGKGLARGRGSGPIGAPYYGSGKMSYPEGHTYKGPFKERFLDIWYNKYPVTYIELHRVYGGVGNDMLVALNKEYPELYEIIFNNTLN